MVLAAERIDLARLVMVLPAAFALALALALTLALECMVVETAARR